MALAALVSLGDRLGAGQTPAGAEAANPTLTVCQVLAHPLQFDGRMVTIRGRVAATDEGGWHSGDECRGAVVTEGHVWPSLIFLAMPTTRLRLHSVDFDFDKNSRSRTELKYRSLIKLLPNRCLLFTYSGLFETRRDWSAAKLTYPDHTWRFAGFGHLGDAPAQLILRAEDDVVAAPNCPAGSPQPGAAGGK